MSSGTGARDIDRERRYLLPVAGELTARDVPHLLYTGTDPVIYTEAASIRVRNLCYLIRRPGSQGQPYKSEIIPIEHYTRALHTVLDLQPGLQEVHQR